MDATSIGAAQAGIKALLQIAKGATDAAVDHKLKQKLIDIQSGILDAQQRLGDAQSERLDLLSEVAQLRQRLRDLEEAKAALDAYELSEVEPGKYLYRARADAGHAVDHYACPVCHNNGRVSILQSSASGAQQRLYVCKQCGFGLYVGPSEPRTPINREHSPYKRSW